MNSDDSSHAPFEPGRAFRRRPSRISIPLLLLIAASTAQGADLRIEVGGLRGGQGQLRVALYAEGDRFLDENAMVAGIRVRASEVRGGVFAVTLHGLLPGRYAVTAHLDEEGDGTRDTNLLGIPTEGYGFSNDAKGTMGPPAFDDAAFEVGERPAEIKVELHY